MCGGPTSIFFQGAPNPLATALGAGVDDQSVPGMRNDGKWSPNGNG